VHASPNTVHVCARCTHRPHAHRVSTEQAPAQLVRRAAVVAGTRACVCVCCHRAFTLCVHCVSLSHRSAVFRSHTCAPTALWATVRPPPRVFERSNNRTAHCRHCARVARHRARRQRTAWLLDRAGAWCVRVCLYVCAVCVHERPPPHRDFRQHRSAAAVTSAAL
jgi:hypothetical protein